MKLCRLSTVVFVGVASAAWANTAPILTKSESTGPRLPGAIPTTVVCELGQYGVDRLRAYAMVAKAGIEIGIDEGTIINKKLEEDIPLERVRVMLEDVKGSRLETDERVVGGWGKTSYYRGNILIGPRDKKLEPENVFISSYGRVQAKKTSDFVPWLEKYLDEVCDDALSEVRELLR